MKLPNNEQSTVSREKVVNYLLNSNHTVGRAKAIYFTSLGFTADQWELLAAALREHSDMHGVSSIEREAFGTMYVIEGKLRTPRGETLRSVRVVWIVTHGEQHPRLVTAYPVP